MIFGQPVSSWLLSFTIFETEPLDDTGQYSVLKVKSALTPCNQATLGLARSSYRFRTLRLNCHNDWLAMISLGKLKLIWQKSCSLLSFLDKRDSSRSRYSRLQWSVHVECTIFSGWYEGPRLKACTYAHTLQWSRFHSQLSWLDYTGLI